MAITEQHLPAAAGPWGVHLADMAGREARRVDYAWFAGCRPTVAHHQRRRPVAFCERVPVRVDRAAGCIRVDANPCLVAHGRVFADEHGAAKAIGHGGDSRLRVAGERAGAGQV